jgi:hypothetical protein
MSFLTRQWKAGREGEDILCLDLIAPEYPAWCLLSTCESQLRLEALRSCITEQ